MTCLCSPALHPLALPNARLCAQFLPFARSIRPVLGRSSTTRFVRERAFPKMPENRCVRPYTEPLTRPAKRISAQPGAFLPISWLAKLPLARWAWTLSVTVSPPPASQTKGEPAKAASSRADQSADRRRRRRRRKPSTKGSRCSPRTKLPHGSLDDRDKAREVPGPARQSHDGRVEVRRAGCRRRQRNAQGGEPVRQRRGGPAREGGCSDGDGGDAARAPPAATVAAAQASA